jgi:DNA-binding response OmpR family regulator
MNKNKENKKILIADSSSLVVSILKKLLEKENICVFTATDGNEVLEIVKTENPICVAFNSKLPTIDGTSLCRIIKHGMSLKSIK